MGKYEPLRRHLENLDSPHWDVEFSDIEKVLGFPLPASAYRHSAWWANETHGSHSHARGWQDAGWETQSVDLAARKLRFRKARPDRGGESPQSANQARPQADLWERAQSISGIEDRQDLIEAALRALIHREASRRLAALGGSMPDLQVPPRERPDW